MNPQDACHLLVKIQHYKNELKTQDDAELWQKVPIVVNLGELFQTIFSKIPRHRHLDDLRHRIDSLFALKDHEQRAIMEHLSLPTWKHQADEVIARVAEAVYAEFIYTQTYHDFSDQSRDNQAKADVLASLGGQPTTYLEIGSGPGALLSKLNAKRSNVSAIEIDVNMVNACLARHVYLRDKITIDNFFSHKFSSQYDVVYIESGFFLITRIPGFVWDSYVFEIFEGDESAVMRELNRIYRLIKPNGVFAIGVQGLMQDIQINPYLHWTMQRTQKKHHCERAIQYYYHANGNTELALELHHHKPTWPLRKFKKMAIQAGFKSVELHKSKQWVIVKK